MDIDQFAQSMLFDAVKDTAVDVVTKRTVDNRVKLLGSGYRSFSLIEKAFDVENAIRIAVYSDVVGIIVSEIIVKTISTKISNAVELVDGINFQAQELANGFLIKPDFTVRMAHNPEALQPIYMVNRTKSIIEKEFETDGAELAGMVLPCLEYAIRSYENASTIIENPASDEPRRREDWKRKKNMLDSINRGLGYAIWRPVPTIGLGYAKITNISKYKGIFRRDSAEGYGKIEWANRDCYVGQVRNGWERGYGVKIFNDGKIFVGYFNDHQLGLGVSVDRERNRVFVGAHSDGRLEGYGRQIGLRQSVESFNGFWNGGEISKKVKLHGDIYKEISNRYKNNSLFHAIYEEYFAKSKIHLDKLHSYDRSLIKIIERFY